MKKPILFDAVIIGGSYPGLSASMALGRSLRNIVVIDSGTACNAQTPRSHNFLTQDGKTPAEITALAREQVASYPNVRFVSGLATEVIQNARGFEVKTWDGEIFTGRKLLLTTGITDILPETPGMKECWGISLIHCPYCHGYEFRNEKTGILANAETAFEMAKMISNWTPDLIVFTNGNFELTAQESEKLQEKGIRVEKLPITALLHQDGHVHAVLLSDGSKTAVSAIYTRPAFVQQSDIAQQLGCEFQSSGHIKADAFQKTSVAGIFAAGDNCSQMRSIASSVAAGSLAGVMVNKELIDEDF